MFSPKSQRKQFTTKMFLMYNHKVTQLSLFKIKTKQKRLAPRVNKNFKLEKVVEAQ